METIQFRPYHRKIRRIFFYAFVTMVTAIFIFPIYWFMATSFKNPVDILSLPPVWIFKPILKNYLELFRVQHFQYNILNSFIISGCVVGLSLILGVPAAYALSRIDLRGAKFIYFWILTSRMIPPMALLVPFFLFFNQVHLLDSHLALIIIYLTFNLALVVWIMRTFFDDVPLSLEEAAVIDGCSTWRCFWKISLPLVSPGLAATTIFCWIMSWNEFLYALILTRRVAQTAPVAVTVFMRFIDIRWGTIAAGSTFIMLPIIIFSIVVNKYLIAGLVRGALKE